MRKQFLLCFCLAGALPAMASAADNPLAQAVRASDHAAIQTLLAAHPDVNELLPDKTTVLAWAVDRQDTESVRLLLAAGAKPNIVGVDGGSPLTLACERGGAEIVTELLK